MVTEVAASRVVLLFAGAALLGVGMQTYRSGKKDVERTFAVLAGLLGATAACLAVTAATGWIGGLVWLYTNLAIPVVLVAFSLGYYGVTVDSPERRAAVLAPALIGAVGGTILLLGTSAATGVSSAPVGALADLPGWVYDGATAFDRLGYYYTAALIVFAVALVGYNVLQYEHLDNRLSIVIAFIGAWPWFGNFVVPELTAMMGYSTAMVLLAVGYASSAAVAGLLIGPLGLFESSPAAGNVGPEVVLDTIDDPVFMIDESERVLRVNDAAGTLVGGDQSTVVGRTLGEVLSVDPAGLSADTRVELETADGVRQFAVTRSAVSSRHGTQGAVVVLRDVTEELTREQRLEVLNRVLRHNLRNNATSIIGRAELISDGGQREQFAEKIVDSTRELVETAERAREIERMMNAPQGGEPVDLDRIVETVVEEVRADYPAVDFTTALPEAATARVSPQVLETVIRNLVDNAARHNDADQPFVVVSADETDDGALSVAVSDNGPGIPEHEQSVLDAGGEDQLDHSSGLGLWAAQWGVTQMGGQLSIRDNEPRGTVVIVTVPTARVTQAPVAQAVSGD